MSVYRLLWAWLLAFAITLQCLCAQDQTGFISIDCGSDQNSYNDSTTGLHYTTDEEYVDGGQERMISPQFQTNNVSRQLFTLRSFPELLQGSIICYTLEPVLGKDQRILLRLGFMYGNYDAQSQIPQFDLQLGANEWETVTFQSTGDVVIVELLHIPTSDYVDVCLVNTGNGTPFINFIELRPIDPIYNATSGSLRLFQRRNLESTTNQKIRYKDDPYDRIWTPGYPYNTSTLTDPNLILKTNPFNLPLTVMNTAIEAQTVNDNISFVMTPRNASDQIYIYLHFTGISPNITRNISIYINDKLFYRPPFSVAYKDMNTIYSTEPESYSEISFSITAVQGTEFPPTLNAVELYSVQQFPHFETVQDDVAAMKNVKSAYLITRNWEGDPCLPTAFVWTGIKCSYNGFGPPRIISLDLSSSGLSGLIAPSISNMTMLQYLDLSNNSLTGEVPAWLASLSNLKSLNISRNNFNGSLPAELLEKSRNGALSLISDTNNGTTSDTRHSEKRPKKKIFVPIVVSVAAVILVIGLSIVLWVITNKKRQNIKDPTRLTNASNKGEDSIIKPRFRRYAFAEVQDFINEDRIIGKGGFGTVYHGVLDGRDVAIKKLINIPDQDFKDFQSAVNILATVHHKNLTSILGYFNEGTNQGIIFEFLERGNLSAHLSAANPTILTWELRLQIAADVAEGLRYLHHECPSRIIHRDIKPSNILLTKDFRAKLADFGFSRPFELESVRIVGTIGYRDPRYIHPRMLKEKVDIYSFGVVLLQLVTGQSPTLHGSAHITLWVHSFIDKGDIQGIVDPRLQQNFDINVAWRVVELAMKCVSQDASSRPNMNYIVKELKECWALTVDAHEYDEKSPTDSSALRHSMMGRIFQPYTR